ncbi:MAG: hypothetical protein M3Y09_13320 [Actinomycetota bacterium]|nr:hypothetical protein [Actinomycetota bacterium]
MPNRDLIARLPDIELADLARSINRPDKRSGRPGEQRPNLPQIVINDRLARDAPQRFKQLPDPDAGQLGILGQQPVDLRFERLQDPHLRYPLITQRRLTAQRPTNRVLRQPRLAHQALDRLSSDEMLASQLSPPLHLDHPSAALSHR